MNINSVSFQAGLPQEKIVRQPNQNITLYRNPARPQQDSYNHQSTHRSNNQRPQQDSFNHQQTQKSNNPRPQHRKKHPTPLSHLVKGFTAGAIAAGTITASIFSNSAAAKPPKAIEINIEPNTSMEEFVDIAELYGVDPLALIDYNNIDANGVTHGETIMVPSNFDNLQDEISSTETKLHDKNLSDTKRASLEDKLAQLREKQALQDSIATVYTDGEYVYYELKKYEDGQYPDNLPEKYRNKINVEEFKLIFDIKDGAIKDNNSLPFTWGSNEFGGYMDFTTADLYPGRTIKVPVNAVKTSDINLEY